MTSEALYRYLGRNPEYQPNSLSIVGGCEGAGFGMTSRREKFLEALGGGDLNFDDINGHIFIIGGDDEEPSDEPSDDIFGAGQKLREMFSGGDEDSNEDNNEASETDDVVLNSCPRADHQIHIGGDDTTADESSTDNDTNTAAGIIEEEEVGLTYGSNDTDLSDLFV